MLSKILITLNVLSRLKIKCAVMKWRKDSKNILWIPTDGLLNFLKYLFGSAQFVHDASILNYLIENEESYRFVIGLKHKETLTSKNIYYKAIYVNWFGLYNYVSSSQNILLNLQLQGNKLYPPLEDYMYWENKAYMHRMFIQKKINHPKTLELNVNNSNNQNIINNSFKYPFLIKEIHSAASQGLYKINNYDDFKKITLKIKSKGGSTFLVQKLIEMRRDLRVILVGNEIVLHYWRINQSSIWKPTSTSFGSKTDFNSFPYQWKDLIIKSFKSTGLNSGAFDITWENDDLSLEPIFLELSPFYQTNPKPPKRYSTLPYFEYKKIKFGKDNYISKFVETSFDVQSKVLKVSRKKLN